MTLVVKKMQTQTVNYSLRILRLPSKLRPRFLQLKPLPILVVAFISFLSISWLFTFSSNNLSSQPSTFQSISHYFSDMSQISKSKPPSKKEIGNAGWILIHSIAANFPEKPSDNEKYHAKAFLRSISKLYPCKRCRSHFDSYITQHPPELESREKFMVWACGAHNAVNKRLGKTEFPCKMNKLEHRWGDCGCQLKKK